LFTLDELFHLTPNNKRPSAIMIRQILVIKEIGVITCFSNLLFDVALTSVLCTKLKAKTNSNSMSVESIAFDLSRILKSVDVFMHV
jgi:hypothetical protein